MIRKMYIINKSGVCIYHIDFSIFQVNDEKNQNQDAQLIGGFFTAMDSFASTAVKSTQKLRSIVLTDIIYYFHNERKRIYVLETDSLNKNMFHEDYVDILKEISTLFDDIILQENDDDLIMDVDNAEFTEEVKHIVSKNVKKSLFKNTVSQPT